ncbi:MAG TPA: tripartite tricarboxylate transporter permease [Anaeromyxobacter sp.]
MDFLQHLELGFVTALSLRNVLYCFLGCFLGTAIGVLPGLGPVPTIAMLLPLTYALSPVTALIMLAGIFYGAQYGGSTTSILVNLPGESSSVVTCIDGYQMARRGRAGAALTIAAVGSFFAGTFSTAIVAGFAPTLAEVAFKFGPAEYFSLMVVGLLGAVTLAHGSQLKAIAMIVLGVLLGLVGTDVNSGAERFALGVPELGDGINFVVVAMGLFAFGEIIHNLETTAEAREVFTENVKLGLLTRQEARESAPAVLRGTLLGSLLGILPGGGAVLASFAAYALEKRVAKHPERFGTGAIAGVAGPESANNAAAQTSFIPMLCLGLPGNATMALMAGAMTIHSIQPGPQVMTSNPELFWGLVCSMWVGNVMLLVLNLPLIGIWVKFLTIPYRLLFPAILLFCAIGTYSLANSTVDVLLTIPFGVLGYVFAKLECEPAPLLLGFVLGPMLEENLTRAMLLSRGRVSIFFTRPLSLGLLVIAAGLMGLMLLPVVRNKRAEVFVEG